MSWWNLIEADWTCPFCKQRQSGEVRFEYGGPQNVLHVGDDIDMPAFGTLERLPNDTGTVPSLVECAKNDWLSNWLLARGDVKTGDQTIRVTGDPPSQEEMKALGCPDFMYAHVEVVSNRIKRVYFPDDPKLWRAEWRETRKGLTMYWTQERLAEVIKRRQSV